jgi:hypothetical protein
VEYPLHKFSVWFITWAQNCIAKDTQLEAAAPPPPPTGTVTVTVTEKESTQLYETPTSSERRNVSTPPTEHQSSKRDFQKFNSEIKDVAGTNPSKQQREHMPKVISFKCPVILEAIHYHNNFNIFV